MLETVTVKNKGDLFNYVHCFGRNTPVDFSKYYDTYVNHIAPDNSIKNEFEFMTLITEFIKCHFLFHYQIDIVRRDLDDYGFKLTEEQITSATEFHELYYNHLENETPFYIVFRDFNDPLPKDVELSFMLTFSQLNFQKLQVDDLFNCCLFQYLKLLKINPNEWRKKHKQFKFTASEVSPRPFTVKHKEFLDAIPIDSSLKDFPIY